MLSLETIERVKKIKDLDLKAEDGEELTDAYVHILYCYMEKLQSIVRCYPGAPLTAIVDEMKELCDEHESTVTNRFLPEKKKGDAANCWNAYVSCRRSVIRIYANLFQDRTRPRVGVAFLQRQHCSFSLLRAPRREGRDSLCGGLFIRMRVTLSFSNFPRGTRRPRGMQANLETGAGSRTNSP